MAAVLEHSAMTSSITGALIVSLINGLCVGMTIVPISGAEAQLGKIVNSTINKQINVSTTNIAVSGIERELYLQELQSETLNTMGPALAFLYTIAVVGLIGNSLVIIVYSRKRQWNATGALVIVLSVLDLISNIIAIPAEIYDIHHTWDFNNSYLCKARMFTSTFTTLSSGMILAVLAVTRYRKVCHAYEWQITTRKAKLISIVVCCFGGVLATPFSLIFGRHTKLTTRQGIVAFECSIVDEYIETFYPLIMYLVFLLLYVVCSATLTALYILIGITACRHSKIHGRSFHATSEIVPNGIESNATELPYNQSECNCTRCGSSYEKTEISITGQSAMQNTSGFVDVKMKQFRVGRQAADPSVRYDANVFTDRTMERAQLGGEFFVTPQKTNPGIEVAEDQDKNESNSTCNGNEIQFENGCREENRTSNTRMIRRKNLHFNGSSEDTRTVDIRIIKNNSSDSEVRSVKSSFDDIGSKKKYTESCTSRLCNEENKLMEAQTKDIATGTFHREDRSKKTISKYVTVLNVFKGPESEKRYLQSKLCSVNAVIKKYDPGSVLKWLDAIYCIDTGPSRAYSDSVHREPSLSFRDFLHKDCMQYTEWVRTAVTVAVATQDTTKGISHRRIRTRGSNVDSQRYSCHSLDESSDNGSNQTFYSQLTSYLCGFNRQDGDTSRKVFVQATSTQPSTAQRRPVTRTTVMLIIISAIYILCYLPHLVLMLAQFLSPGFVRNLSTFEITLYNLGMRSFYLNCAVDPIIYSLCDINFRQECFKVIKLYG